MAQITQAEGSVGVTKNLGNYESLRLDVRETRKLDAGDDVEQVYKDLFDHAMYELSQQYSEAVTKIAGANGVSFLKIG